MPSADPLQEKSSLELGGVWGYVFNYCTSELNFISLGKLWDLTM